VLGGGFTGRDTVFSLVRGVLASGTEAFFEPGGGGELLIRFAGDSRASTAPTGWGVKCSRSGPWPSGPVPFAGRAQRWGVEGTPTGTRGVGGPKKHQACGNQASRPQFAHRGIILAALVRGCYLGHLTSAHRVLGGGWGKKKRGYPGPLRYRIHHGIARGGNCFSARPGGKPRGGCRAEKLYGPRARRTRDHISKSC